MKDKLEHNMYVRTKNGSIDKITDITEELYQREGDEDEKPYKIYKLNNTYYDDEFDEDTNWFFADFFVKSSHNIIDLIEVGDYVNGEKVGYIDDCDGAMREYYYDYEDASIDVGHWFEEIKSIVTKESIESVTYYVK